MKHLAITLSLVAAGCGALPRDPDGTGDRIRASGLLRIGVEGTPPPAAQRLVVALAAETGATPRVRHAPLEPMIAALDADALDLVIAPVAKRTPWKTQVALAPPLAILREGGEEVAWRAIAKNGENRWIMQVEAASRKAAPGPADE